MFSRIHSDEKNLRDDLAKQTTLCIEDLGRWLDTITEESFNGTQPLFYSISPEFSTLDRYIYSQSDGILEEIRGKLPDGMTIIWKFDRFVLFSKKYAEKKAEYEKKIAGVMVFLEENDTPTPCGGVELPYTLNSREECILADGIQKRLEEIGTKCHYRVMFRMNRVYVTNFD